MNLAMALQHYRAKSYLLRKKKALPAFSDPESYEQEEKKDFHSRNLICKVCSGKVTSKKDQFTKNGCDEHGFFNPHGIAFVLGCFNRAPGCVISGDPSTEFSWFKGYTWSFAMCVHCREHLGWFFQGRDGDSFFGLILLKLREDA